MVTLEISQQPSMLTQEHAAIIARQRLFFTASAPAWSAGGPCAASHIELQPKAGLTLVMVDASTVAFADVSSSGGRAALQLRAHGSGPLTLLIMDTEGPTEASGGMSTLLRLSGRGFAVASSEIDPETLSALPTAEVNTDTSSRWVFVLRIEHAQFECDALSTVLLVGPGRHDAPSLSQRRRSPHESQSDMADGYPADVYRTFSSAVDDVDLAAVETQYELMHARRVAQSRLGSIPEDGLPQLPAPNASTRRTPPAQRTRARLAQPVARAAAPPSDRGSSGSAKAAGCRARARAGSAGGAVAQPEPHARGRRQVSFHSGPSWRALLLGWRLPVTHALLGIGAAALAFEGAALARLLLRAASKGQGGGSTPALRVAR